VAIPGVSEIDFTARKSIARYGPIGRLFPANSGGCFHERIARLAVLYEDLRIELLAAAAYEIPIIDGISIAYRQQYFMRRTVATLCEFGEALWLVDQSEEFKLVKAAAFSASNEYLQSDWLPAVSYFSTQKKLLKDIRNDIGGHFGSKAAEYAVQHVDDCYVAKIAMEEESADRHRALLFFASELAATAMLRHLPGDDVQNRVAVLMKLLEQGVEHAVQAVHFIIAECYWNRLG
jgi:hypothetical protein